MNAKLTVLTIDGQPVNKSIMALQVLLKIVDLVESLEDNQDIAVDVYKVEKESDATLRRARENRLDALGRFYREDYSW